MHQLIRTNEKGHVFVGRCVVCGELNIPIERAGEACSGDNCGGDVIIEAVKGAGRFVPLSDE